MPADGTHNLNPCKKGETHNPNGRPKKLATRINGIPKGAQLKIYSTLYEAIHSGSKDEAAGILQKAAKDLPEYGLIYQLATKELLGKNGWTALNDILDRLFGKAKQTVDMKAAVSGKPVIQFETMNDTDEDNSQ